jgi:hypothetical protein
MMLRRNLMMAVFCGAIGGVFGAGSYAINAPTAACAAMRLPPSELQKALRLAKGARSARELIALAPPSWGPAPWLFESEAIIRGQPVRVLTKVGSPYDTVHDGLRAIAVPYGYRYEDAAGWVEGTRHFIKGPVE